MCQTTEPGRQKGGERGDTHPPLRARSGWRFSCGDELAFGEKLQAVGSSELHLCTCTRSPADRGCISRCTFG
jgi:hypothetical protein